MQVINDLRIHSVKNVRAVQIILFIVRINNTRLIVDKTEILKYCSSSIGYI